MNPANILLYCERLKAFSFEKCLKYSLSPFLLNKVLQVLASEVCQQRGEK